MEYGLPREKKYPLNTRKRAISAIAYAKKNARNGELTPAKRDTILRKVHRLYPDINITPVRGRRKK